MVLGRLAPPQTAVLAALAACFWALGPCCRTGCRCWASLTLLAAVASTVTSTLGMVGAHKVVKPLTMLLAGAGGGLHATGPA